VSRREDFLGKNKREDLRKTSYERQRQKDASRVEKRDEEGSWKIVGERETHEGCFCVYVYWRDAPSGQRTVIKRIG